MKTKKLALCGKPLKSRSKFADIALPRCYKPAGHSGPCEEFHYLSHLKEVAPLVAKKIQRDSTNTTGAAWKSSDAGPNRILRWAMLLSDEELLKYDLDMSKLRPGIIAKLREKKATYTDCMEVAAKLAWSTYKMKNAPVPPDDIKDYLAARVGHLEKGPTVCLICKEPLDFADFAKAKRGKAAIETAHASPRQHEPGNVGFAHRECNIAQGDKTLDEFYDWIQSILTRVGRI